MSSTLEDVGSWRLRTPRYNIPYRVLDREGSFEKERASFVEIYIIESRNMLLFAQEAFPEPVVINNRIIYPPPMSPGPALIPKKVSFRGHTSGRPIDPFGMDPGAPARTYEKFLQVSVEYETMEKETILEISAEAAGEFISTTAPAGEWVPPATGGDTGGDTPGGGGDDGADPDANNFITTPIHIVVPTTAWTVVLPQVPWEYFNGFLVGYMRGNMGYVNSHPMPAFFGAPPETILFMGYSLKRQYTWRSAEPPPFRLELKFAEKHILDENTFEVYGHNHFWKPDLGWSRIKFDGSRDVYKQSNLNGLLSGF